MVTDYLRDYILPNIISNLYDSLETYNGALFYAYENGVVFSQRGNKEMLKYLNSLNLGIGTCITEEYIGTTGMAFVKMLPGSLGNWGRTLLRYFYSFCYPLFLLQ